MHESIGTESITVNSWYKSTRDSKNIKINNLVKVNYDKVLQVLLFIQPMSSSVTFDLEILFFID